MGKFQPRTCVLCGYETVRHRSHRSEDIGTNVNFLPSADGRLLVTKPSSETGNSLQMKRNSSYLQHSISSDNNWKKMERKYDNHFDLAAKKSTVSCF